MDSERLEILLQRHFDQVLTVPERRELEQMLLASSKARAAFWESSRWHALIRQWGEAEWGRSPAGDSPVDAGDGVEPRRPGLRLAWALAAAFVLLAAVGVWFGRPALPPGEFTQRTESNGEIVAVLTRLLDVRWPAGTAPRHQGEVLPSGRLRLEAGLVELETERGARLVLEGPADLEISPQGEVHLRAGKLWASLPEAARGTRLQTGAWRVTNVIGSVGCAVSATDGVAVHVFEGMAEIRAEAEGAMRLIRAGQSLVAAATGPRAGLAEPRQFVSDAVLAERVALSMRRELDAWRGFSRELNRRKDLLVHLDFERESEGGRTLPNRAERAMAGSGASLVGCDWVEGRWPGKGAVEFKRGNDRLWLNVPGAMEAMTFLAWVRVDSLPHVMHALFTADGPGGKITWALRQNGALALGMHVPQDGKGLLVFRSETKVRPEQLGAWLCLGTVLAADGTVTHYINGEVAGRGRLAEKKPGRLGKCEIGNAAEETTRDTTGPGRSRATAGPGRNFIGRMDDFAIFAAALGPEEIQRFHAAGRGAGTRTPLQP